MRRSWSAREWLPNAATLTLIGVATKAASVVVEADGPASARCPACGRPSQTRHGRYWRTLRDLAAQGRSVTLRVHVSRCRCGAPHCGAALFADRLTGVSAPRLQHTQRFGAVAHLVGHALGGRGGERLLARGTGQSIEDAQAPDVWEGRRQTPPRAPHSTAYRADDGAARVRQNPEDAAEPD
jgi:transposase